MHKLKIENLNVEIENKKILNDLNLEVKSGEIHVIMGPNGTGKSTLSKVIMGDENYKITSGNILYDDKIINDLKVDERANLGIFLSVQLPLEIEGVTIADLLRTAVHNKQKDNFKLFEFIKELESRCNQLGINKDMVHRSINVGFSGGERKKNEILQMYMLKPDLILLDEIDSGLDVDSLKIVGENVMSYFKEYNPAIIVITHYQRLLDYIKPNFVHILKNGSILKTGDASLVKEIENDGYNNIKLNKSSACIVKENL